MASHLRSSDDDETIRFNPPASSTPKSMHRPDRQNLSRAVVNSDGDTDVSQQRKKSIKVNIPVQKFSKKALGKVEELVQDMWSNAILELKRNAKHAGHRKIRTSDVELLMQRFGGSHKSGEESQGQEPNHLEPNQRRRRKSNRQPRARRAAARIIRQCTNCRILATRHWRRNSFGGLLCNRCGLFRRRHHVDRPY